MQRDKIFSINERSGNVGKKKLLIIVVEIEL